MNDYRNIQKFGRRLAVLRQRSGKTQREVAAALDVTPQAVSKWERGLSCPDVLMLNDLASALGVTIANLFEANAAE